MASTFVLIVTQPGFEHDVLQSLNPLPSVKEAYAVYGIYDILARVEAETVDELKAVIWRIRRIDKVSSTLTMIIA
jgi:DNA-binding Lrp family transcriptional regulator